MMNSESLPAGVSFPVHLCLPGSSCEILELTVLPSLIDMNHFLIGSTSFPFFGYIVYVWFFFDKHGFCLYLWTLKILLLSSLYLEVKELDFTMKDMFLPSIGN